MTALPHHADDQRILRNSHSDVLGDHPPPHFHAIYGEYEAQYTIETLDVIKGSLPRRAHALVVEWASLHKDELMKNWAKCKIPIPPLPIDPLE